MAYYAFVALTAFATLTQAAALVRRAEPQCTDFLIPVSASSSQMVPAGNIPTDLQNSTVLTDYLVSQASSGLAGILGGIGSVEQSGNFNMSARYCVPAVSVASRANTIQYLQHAITNTKNYWNGLTYPVGFDGDMYSYSKVASDVSGGSLPAPVQEHPSPLFDIPLRYLEEAFADPYIFPERIPYNRYGQSRVRQQLSSRPYRCGPNGSSDRDRRQDHRDAPQWPGPGTRWGQSIRQSHRKSCRPSKSRTRDLILTTLKYVGHSYGSIQGNALAATFPDAVDTYVLTGYSGRFVTGLVPLAAGLALPAALVMPRFAGLPVGYLAQSYEPGRVYGLYTVDGVGGFDPAIPQYVKVMT